MKGLVSSVIVMTVVLAASLIAQTAPAKAVDITGQWAASFETQVGTQTYTYDFVVKDGKLTGKIKGSLSDAPTDVQDGKVTGDAVTFVENLSFQGMDVRIVYNGKIVSDDEIKFRRDVGEFATEEFVAKRVKK